jgi:hypothetical protein
MSAKKSGKKNKRSSIQPKVINRQNEMVVTGGPRRNAEQVLKKGSKIYTTYSSAEEPNYEERGYTKKDQEILLEDQNERLRRI